MIPVERGWFAFWILLGAGFVSTLVSIAVFSRFAERDRLRAAINRVIAHLFEFRLFADEPLLVLRAQRDLVVANLQMLRYAALPSIILLAPFAVLFLCLDGYFARAPLRIDEAAVVTTNGLRPAMPPQVRVETPPVHVLRTQEVSWRIRPLASVEGEIVAGTGLRWISPYSRLKITYPPARVFHHHWLVWYLLGTIAGCVAYYAALRTA